MKGDKLYMQAFREIRAYILKNGLCPGDLLPSEQALCEMLGVSRNVLREAIKSMELMGMVAAQPGRGTVLLPFSLDFIFQNVILSTAGEDHRAIGEMLGIRKKLELSYMHDAYAALTDADIRELRAIFETMRRKWSERTTFHADDRLFHMSLFKGLNNPTLLSLMDAIWSVDENFMQEEKVKFLSASLTKHENIVLALEAHNRDAFVAAMIAHFASHKYLVGRENFAEL